jgi:hypothetical protein
VTAGEPHRAASTASTVRSVVSTSGAVGMARVSVDSETGTPASNSSVTSGNPIVRSSVIGLSDTRVPDAASAATSASEACTAWTTCRSGPSSPSSPSRVSPQERQPSSRRQRSQCMVIGRPSSRASAHSCR